MFLQLVKECDTSLSYITLCDLLHKNLIMHFLGLAGVYIIIATNSLFHCFFLFYLESIIYNFIDLPHHRRCWLQNVRKVSTGSESQVSGNC